MNIVAEKTRLALAALAAGLFLLPVSALADSGFYIGGSFGNAAVEGDVGGFGLEEFDADDSAYKAFLGYRFDLPSVFLAVEGGYVDLGEPEFDDFVSIDSTGLNLFGIAGLEAGPIEFFAKAGYVAWDADIVIGDIERSRDGSYPAYGVGIAFSLGPVYFRGEYERYDIDDVFVLEITDVDMISVGFSYLFD